MRRDDMFMRTAGEAADEADLLTALWRVTALIMLALILWRVW